MHECVTFSLPIAILAFPQSARLRFHCLLYLFFPLVVLFWLLVVVVEIVSARRRRLVFNLECLLFLLSASVKKGIELQAIESQMTQFTLTQYNTHSHKTIITTTAMRARENGKPSPSTKLEKNNKTTLHKSQNSTTKNKKETINNI